MPEDKTRIESLDSLRGLAAVAVIASHINLDYFNFGATTPFKNTPLHIFYDGDAAVVFFFVLSGFVLSYKYVSNGGEGLKKLSLPSFVVSRIFRIYPLWWAALALTAVCAFNFSNAYSTIPARTWTPLWYQQPFSWPGFLKQLTLIYMNSSVRNIIGPITGDGFIPQGWSLNIELLLSILVPILILIASRRALWLIFFTLVMAGFFDVYIYLIHFTMGILLALFLPQINGYLLSKKGIFKASVLMAGVLLYSYRYSVASYFPTVSLLQKLLFSETSVLFFIGLGVILIMVSVLNSTRLNNVLTIPAMRLMGKVSYGIYLCHTIMLVFFTPFLIYYLNQAGITNTVLVLVVAFISTTTGSIIIAYILHRLVELPFITFGKKVNAFLWSRQG